MDKALAKEEEMLKAVKAHLEDGKMARSFEVPDDEDLQKAFKEYNLLTAKPTIYAANVAEDDMADDGASNKYVQSVREIADKEGSGTIVICAQMEQELAELDEEEKKEYLEELGVTSSGLDKLVTESYSLLGLISFLTAGEDECRAWTIKKGTKAPQAAGKIHTDFERGFIKAEVVPYEVLIKEGSLSAAKEKGLVGLEGKEYVVKDGDVILFRFNV
jgi:GTP-binding protein YchF